MSLAHSKMEERGREREQFLCTIACAVSAAAKVRDEGAEGRGERGQAVKHVGFVLLMLTRT
jgi:hypothetical protein